MATKHKMGRGGSGHPPQQTSSEHRVPPPPGRDAEQMARPWVEPLWVGGAQTRNKGTDE